MFIKSKKKMKTFNQIFILISIIISFFLSSFAFISLSSGWEQPVSVSKTSVTVDGSETTVIEFSPLAMKRYRIYLKNTGTAGTDVALTSVKVYEGPNSANCENDINGGSISNTLGTDTIGSKEITSYYGYIKVTAQTAGTDAILDSWVVGN